MLLFRLMRLCANGLRGEPLLGALLALKLLDATPCRLPACFGPRASFWPVHSRGSCLWSGCLGLAHAEECSCSKPCGPWAARVWPSWVSCLAWQLVLLSGAPTVDPWVKIRIRPKLVRFRVSELENPLVQIKTKNRNP